MTDGTSDTSWGLIRVEGAEAGKFLHSQLTNSMEDLSENELRLAGFCTAKGRLLGSFFVWRTGETFFLLCKKDTVEGLVKRLNMFKLRSKCVISDASNQTTFEFLESVEQKHMSVKTGDISTTLAFRPRPGKALAFGVSVVAGAGQGQSNDFDVHFDFHLQTIGLPWICRQTVEKYIPQEINFDLIGGINFEKGCYPGQEIVARSHYIGKVKRRSFLAQIPASQSGEIECGRDVWLKGKTNEPAGSIVTSCKVGGVFYLMIETVASDGQDPASVFLLGENDSHELQMKNPPYDLLAKGNQYA